MWSARRRKTMQKNEEMENARRNKRKLQQEKIGRMPWVILCGNVGLFGNVKGNARKCESYNPPPPAADSIASNCEEEWGETIPN